MKWIISIAFPLALIYSIFVHPMSKPGLTVGSDWIFPYSNQQLKHLGSSWNRLWNDYELPTGSQTPHKNLFLYELLANSLSATGISGIAFQKIMVVLTLLLIYFASLFLFYRVTKRNDAASIGAVIYLFSPIVFNYFSMGWQFVLLFIAVMPILALLWINFLEKSSCSSLLAIAIISAITFFQSQSVFWIPILLIVITVSFLPQIGWKKASLKLFQGLFAVFFLLAAVHVSWYYPTSLFPSKTITASTSANDIYRFSVVNGLARQITGWGSLFNEQFELSFIDKFKIFTYLPIISIILLVGISKTKESSFKRKYKILSLLLIVVSPVFYIFRYPISSLPLSIIIRDNSRFIIFTNLGFALAISLLWSNIKAKIPKIFLLAGLALLIHPYLYGRLFLPRKQVYGLSEFSKDQRARNLIIPWQENEGLIRDEKTQKGLFFPVGGAITSLNDSRFQVTFSWVGDSDSFYTPSVSGLLISDKNESKTDIFIKSYLGLANNDKESFSRLSQIYGIDKIFIRQGLIPTNPLSPSYDWTMQGCRETNKNDSDWAIGRVCDIPKPYPLIFAGSYLQNATPSAFFGNIKKTGDFLVSVDCGDGGNKAVCQEIPKRSGSKVAAPQITYQPLGPTRYQVEVKDMKTNFFLVLNKTFHRGWIITDMNGRRLDYAKTTVNELVNGWLVPYEGISSSKFIIEFLPGSIYQKLLPFSLGSLAAAMLGAAVLYYFEKKKRR